MSTTAKAKAKAKMGGRAIVIDGEAFPASEVAGWVGVRVVERDRGCLDLDEVLIEREPHLFPERGRAAYVPGLGMRPIRDGEIVLGAIHSLGDDDALDGLRDLGGDLAWRVEAAIESHLDRSDDLDADRLADEIDAGYRRTRGVFA